MNRPNSVLQGQVERPSVTIIREAQQRQAEEAAKWQHPLLKNPEQWLERNKSAWSSCFRNSELFTLKIGCADWRVGERVDLRYPGLGIFNEDLSIAERKITPLLTGSRRKTKVVLLSHDNCFAALNVLEKHNGNSDDWDSLSEWWGAELVKRINNSLGEERAQHQHIRLREMKPPHGPVEALYVDCTDRFNPTFELPVGPTISLLSPGGIRFMASVKIKHLLNNGLEDHLLPSVEFIVKHLFSGKNSSNAFTRKSPLNIILVCDT